MDPATIFCPNLACPARGQVGQGNIGIHARQHQRFICTQCRKTFAATKGTAFYRLRTPAETVALVLTLLAHGCPLQAIVVAFRFDERTVAAWEARAGRQGQAMQEHPVEQPRDLGHVQADEIRVKTQGDIVWMALAMMVKTRLWLAGEVSAQRDMPLIRRRLERVRRCAARRPRLVCTDVLVSSIQETFTLWTRHNGRYARFNGWPQPPSPYSLPRTTLALAGATPRSPTRKPGQATGVTIWWPA
jgi:transposase-like protein